MNEVLEDMRLAASAIRQWMPETHPTSEDGKIHFARLLAESAAEAIEAFLAAPAPADHVAGVEAEIARVVQSINEWDDRTSPDDYPEHLLITSEELSDILRNFASTLTAPTEKQP